MTAKEFYEANATNVCHVPRNEKDKGGWNGVRRAEEARFIAGDVPAMPLWDVFDFAEKYSKAESGRAEERSDKDYAIEHAEYLAKTVEAYQKARNEYDEFSSEGSDATQDEIENASAIMCECFTAMTRYIFEFRKRARRASHSQPSVNAAERAEANYDAAKVWRRRAWDMKKRLDEKDGGSAEWIDIMERKSQPSGVRK